MEISLTLPAVLASRQQAVAALTRACRELHGAEDLAADPRAAEFTHQAVSALVEAFNNVVIHGHPQGQGELSLRIKASAGRLQIELQDYGESFDYEAGPGLPPAEPFALSESGMGLFIIRSCMDEVHYQPGSPNLLQMSKRL